MSNLDLVGEMSLEQLENNVETLFGKAKAEELIYALRTTKIDDSMKNKFYAAIFNNIKFQNSVDSILKNPSALSHIINTVEKEMSNLNYTNTTNIENNINTQELEKRIDKLLNNKDFLENPLIYMQTFSDEELKYIFKNTAETFYQDKDFIDIYTNLLTNYVRNPNDQNTQEDLEQFLGLNSNEDNTEYLNMFVSFNTFCENNKNMDKKNILPLFVEHYQKHNKTISDKNLKRLFDFTNLTPEQQKKFSLKVTSLENKQMFQSNNIKQYNTIDTQIYEDEKDYSNYMKALENYKGLSSEKQEELIQRLKNIQIGDIHQNNVTQTLETDESMQYLEIFLDSNFDMIRDPAENQTEFEYSDLETIFDEVADTNAMQFDFTDQEPIVETPTASSPAEFIQQEMQKQAEEAEKIGDEISKQADLAQDTDKENNYMLEVEEKKGLFSSIKDRFSKFMQKITQKSLPDPNATRAQTTNQSFEAFERKTSIMSTIRSIGDRVTSAVKNISSLNKQNQTPEIKNTATIIGAQKANSQAMEMDNNPTDTNKKSEIIRPKAVQSRPKTNELSSFDQFVKVSNEGNRIEAAAKRDAKGSHNSQDRQQAVVEGSEATSRDDD